MCTHPQMSTMCTHLPLQRWVVSPLWWEQKVQHYRGLFCHSIHFLSPGSRLSICTRLFFLFSATLQERRLHWGTTGEVDTYLKGVFGDNYPLRKEKGWKSWYLDECGERREWQVIGYRRGTKPHEAFTELCHSSPAPLLPLLELSYSFSFVKSPQDTTLPSPPSYFVI